MDLKQLQALGAFVAPVLVKRQVTWETFDEETGKKVSHTFDVHVLKPSYGQIEDVINQAQGPAGVRCALIASCIRLGDKADGQFTLEQARALDPGLAVALVAAINDAGVDLAKKQSRPGQKKKSGSNSSLTA